MTDTTETNARPTHGVYAVTGNGRRSRFNRIGSAWPHKKDGKGFSILLFAVPFGDARMVMRELEEQPTDDANGEAGDTQDNGDNGGQQ